MSLEGTVGHSLVKVKAGLVTQQFHSWDWDGVPPPAPKGMFTSSSFVYDTPS